MTQPQMPKLTRNVIAIAAFLALGAVALGGARGLQFLYAMPTADEYLAYKRSGVTVVPAGKLNFENQSFACERFPAVLNANLDDYGAAYFGFILINPTRFETLPLPIKRYAYAHECGHQYVGYNEGEADCYAIRRGKREGWLTPAVLGEICAFISKGKGDDVHALGSRRCEMMRRCYARARPGREPL
ncbi:MAG: hypothetical protein P8Y67_02890 [Alphaproteobacteria bacterium]